MSREELRDLARRMAAGPNDPTFYERALDAAAVTRRGLELLQELAEEIDGHEPRIRAVADPAQLRAFRPGERLLDPDGEEARTDLADLAAAQLRLSLGAGSAEDLQELLGAFTDIGLKGQLVTVLSDFLSRLPESDIEQLRQAAPRWPALEASSSAVLRVASAMVPYPEGKRGDLLIFAADRLREALSLIRTGREILQELATLLPEPQREAVDPAHFVPGAVVRLGGAVVPTDPLELLGNEVAAIMASKPADLAELERWIGSLIAAFDVDGRPVGTLGQYLTPEVLLELAGALGVPATEPVTRAVVQPVPKRQAKVNLGTLGRALERAPRRLPTIEAAWEVLSSEQQSFSQRFAAGVHLLRQTRELVRENPKGAAAWASRVVVVAERLSAEHDGFASRIATFLETFASAHVGNALRVEGHLLLAERFFLQWDEDDLLGLRAEFLALKATLRRAQRRFAESLDLLEVAERIAARRDFPGASELLAQTRIAAARTLTALSEFPAAAEQLRRALEVTQDAVSGRVRWIALQNLADCLSKAGNLEEAGSLLPEVDALGADVGLPETDRLRTAWVAARVRLPEDWSEAVEHLRLVRQRLIDLGLLYDAALASLELAVWHAEEIAAASSLPDHAVNPEHLAAIRQLAAESAQFFVGADITPEALAALALFHYVSLAAVPSPSTLRKVEQLLRQATLG